MHLFRPLVMEAPPGFEPGRKGFADLCLTTWLWCLIQLNKGRLRLFFKRPFGADYEARTRYLHLGKVALYQMS